eukprot:RCo036062
MSPPLTKHLGWGSKGGQRERTDPPSAMVTAWNTNGSGAFSTSLCLYLSLSHYSHNSLEMWGGPTNPVYSSPLPKQRERIHRGETPKEHVAEDEKGGEASPNPGAASPFISNIRSITLSLSHCSQPSGLCGAARRGV